MKPPFVITQEILGAVGRIERLLGRIESLNQPKPQPHLRRVNRIRTLHGSLAIEGNTLDLDQVTAILDGKPVLGPKKDIEEVVNANAAYDLMGKLDPFAVKDLLKAHRVLMKGLVPKPGQWRAGNVGILKGSVVSHVAPKAERVPWLMDDLFVFLRNDETHSLIRSCVFHYELEFIHPFEDGNGRIGRFWHSLLLFHYHPVFEFIPVESLIRENQQAYYQALERSDRSGDSTPFVEFSLVTIARAIENFLGTFRPRPLTAEERLDRLRGLFGKDSFTRKEYLKLFPSLSTATASRDLKLGVEKGLLEKQGEQARTVYWIVQSVGDEPSWISNDISTWMTE